MKNQKSEDILNKMDDIYNYWCELKSRHPRVFKLIDKGVPFFVVRATEPYAGQVVALIKEKEMEQGTWTRADEDYARDVLGKEIPNIRMVERLAKS